MEKQRQSNFELLRILLMLVVPLYHLMLYGQMNYLPFHKFTIPSLLICSGGAIVADYAFMALSSYFFINSGKRSIVQRFLEVFIQVLFMYGIKMFILRIGLGTKGKNAIFEEFFVQGAWWFIYVYLVIILIYPILNKIIYSVSLTKLRNICMFLGLIFLINDITYNLGFVSDFISFVFTYFVIGYLNRNDFKLFFCFKNNRKSLCIIYVVGFVITFLICLLIKWPGLFTSSEIQTQLLLRFIGRYAIIQFVMGIAVFLLFKSIDLPENKRINNFSKNVFYVFLLHETVMAVFWKLGFLNVVDGKIPYSNIISFTMACFVYIAVSLMFARIVRFVYEGAVKRLVSMVVSKICEINFVKKLEDRYLLYCEI